MLVFLILFIVEGLQVYSISNKDSSTNSYYCIEGKYHKKDPSEEFNNLHEQCRIWENNSCCDRNTTLLLHYEKIYNFDRDHCNKNISKQCEMYFLRDLCFYECSPNVGPWTVEVNSKIRKERFLNVPLCKNECDAWYEACKYDYTCVKNWPKEFKWNKTGNYCPEKSDCITIEEMYGSAKDFCEQVWDYSWKYVENNENCMKMWFDHKEGNPNDAVTRDDKITSNNANDPNIICFSISSLSIFIFYFYN